MRTPTIIVNWKMNTDLSDAMVLAQSVKNGVEVLFDDREEVSAGQKFSDADLIGCPIRLVVSEKTLEKDSVEVKNRDKNATKLVKTSEIISLFK